jgi:hypothetical protein
MGGKMSTDKELRALYNNPAVVYAMNLLTDLGVTGAIYDELLKYHWLQRVQWEDETVGPLDEYRGQ